VLGAWATPFTIRNLPTRRNKMNQRLQAIIERAYTLSAQVLNGDKPDIALAEELSGETAELLAHARGDTGAFESEEVMDMELVALVKQLGESK
jgi:hypothetical protein